MDKKIYCASTNEDYFIEEYDSKEEAIREMSVDLENGDKFYVGISEPINFEDIKNICKFVIDREMFAEQMMDYVGDLADNWLELPKEDWEELHELVAKWIWKKDKPTFVWLMT